MNRLIIAALMFMATMAHAQINLPGSNPTFIDRPQEQDQLQGQAQGQLQGQGQGQVQGQIGINANEQTTEVNSFNVNASQSESKAFSHSDSTSRSYATQRQTATGGEAYSEGSAASSDNAVTIDAREYSADNPVNSPGALYSSGCQVGVAGMDDNVGLSAIVDDPVCTELKLVDAYRTAYANAVAADKAACASVTATNCPLSEETLALKATADEHLARAEKLVNQTRPTGLISKWFGQLSIPAILIGAIALL
jgi:hypothetical protein